MNLFSLLDVSASALKAERERAEVIASNLANAETTRTPAGGPYRRKEVVFGAAPVRDGDFARTLGGLHDVPVEGVRIERVITDPAPPVRRYDPSHPDADGQGYVAYPDINPIEEMVDLIGAARAYQLNVSAVQATKQMILQSLNILTS
jgi:flagellar basal-body rod protein FlgC